MRLRTEAKPVTALNQELEYLQHGGIAEPVEFSDWATPLVVVPKTNVRLRVYIISLLVIPHYTLDTITKITIVK